MAVPTNKSELLADIANSYEKLCQDLQSVPLDLVCGKSLDGHSKNTKMSICNLVAYLIGWGELVLSWHEKKEKDCAVDFPETGCKWNQLGELAQKFYRDYEALNYQELLDTLDNTVTKIVTLIENNTNEELYEKPWYEKYTQGKMIQFNTSSPYKNARTRVRKWLWQQEKSL